MLIQAILIALTTADPAVVVRHTKVPDPSPFYEKGFGTAVTALGDINGDGTFDIAVGEPSTTVGPFSRGSIWILLLTPDGSPATQQHIRFGAGGFAPTPDRWGHFGAALASVGDLDGDGINELAVGEPRARCDPHGFQSGAVWILFLNAEGSVRDYCRIEDPNAPQGRHLRYQSHHFGQSLAPLGDRDGDGIPDLAVGSTRGVTMLFLRRDGTAARHRTIGLPRRFALAPYSTRLAPAGDHDHDGLVDLAVCSRRAGLILMSIGQDGVPTHHTLAEGPAPGSAFAAVIGGLGDLDHDGVEDLAMGLPQDGAESSRGSVHILFLDAHQSIARREVIPNRYRVTERLDRDVFGSSVAPVGDLDGNGAVDLVVGDPAEDCIWVLFRAHPALGDE
ncbi:MAG: hypothetical protein HKO59_03895 [Phycisphaerales bacterium]|nr:integrin alpha [Phycisphaerae bacterium]NNF42019.1 hypothetical protein [Phycisphaerales bacterium]NNM25124.1 hypothetical protein [Phycisphaerales bacterium]